MFIKRYYETKLDDGTVLRLVPNQAKVISMLGIALGYTVYRWRLDIFGIGNFQPDYWTSIIPPCVDEEYVQWSEVILSDERE